MIFSLNSHHHHHPQQSDGSGERIKVLVLGDANVGKTAIVRQFAFDTFSKNQKPTLGVDFHVKDLLVPQFPSSLVTRGGDHDTTSENPLLLPSYGDNIALTPSSTSSHQSNGSIAASFSSSSATTAANSPSTTPPTSACHHHTKQLLYRTVTLELWDIAGQERNRGSGVTRIYYAGATAAVIVCDVTRKDCLDTVLEWKQDLDAKCFNKTNGEKIPCLLLLNKCDLMVTASASGDGDGGDDDGNLTRSISIFDSDELEDHSSSSSFFTTARRTAREVELDQFCERHGFATWFDTSAKTNHNITESFLHLTGQVTLTKQRAEEEEQEHLGEQQQKLQEALAQGKRSLKMKKDKKKKKADGSKKSCQC